MDKYLKASSELYSDNQNEWLKKYVELYKTTLIWPKGLPPISRSNLGKFENRFKKTFKELYEENLNEVTHLFDNDSGSLIVF